MKRIVECSSLASVIKARSSSSVVLMATVSSARGFSTSIYSSRSLSTPVGYHPRAAMLQPRRFETSKAAGGNGSKTTESKSGSQPDYKKFATSEKVNKITLVLVLVAAIAYVYSAMSEKGINTVDDSERVAKSLLPKINVTEDVLKQVDKK